MTIASELSLFWLTPTNLSRPPAQHEANPVIDVITPKANTTTDGRIWNYGWLRQFLLPMKREVNKFDGKRIKEFSR